MKRRNAGASPICRALLAIVLLTSTPLSYYTAEHHDASASGALPLRPASLERSATGAPGEVAAQAQLSPIYDEQLGTTFTQDFASLTYNVTALAQTDANGYGPAYILNGLTTAGYWYQVGISYHWPSSTGGYNPSFGFSYQVYGPNGRPVYPSGGSGLGTFSTTVNSGDLVLLSLTFVGSAVQFLAQDWKTGATAKTSFSSEASSTFVGDNASVSSSHGYFTGIMTEWYHVDPYMGNEEGVTYTNTAFALTSAWLWIDEFDTTATSGGTLFDNTTQTPVTIANDKTSYPFAAGGATMSISAHQFVTGMPSTTTSAATKVTLLSSVTGAPSVSFTASYTTGGVASSADLTTGTNVLDADPGTNVTVSISPSSQGALSKWVFSTASDPTAVTILAGDNSTFVYYPVDEETVSYQVAADGQTLPSFPPPQLAYEEPPAVAGAVATQVTATQSLTATPEMIFALAGTTSGVPGTISGAISGERLAISTNNWIISAPNVIAEPIQYYYQYQITAEYSIVGGGTPLEVPQFSSTSFGSPAAVPLSANGTTGWFDAGASFSYTSILNSSSPSERWLQSGGTESGLTSSGVSGQTIFAPDEEILADYIHQYYADIGVNDASGGRAYGNFSSSTPGPISEGPGWIDAGLRMNITESANSGWQFETWEGSGPGSYNGTDTSISITVIGSFNESATFYVQLAITAQPGVKIAYSYGHEAGTVHAGTAETLYVPPSSNVTLTATPYSVLYSFAPWRGTGLVNPAKPTVALVVDAPSSVAATSSYNYPVVLGAAALVAAILLAVSLVIRSRRRQRLYDLGPPGGTVSSP